MQAGMPTLIEIQSLEACAALCCELGLSFIEINMNLPQYQADRLDVRQLTKIASHYGIHYTIHFAETLNPCDVNDHVAAAYTETVLHTIEIAKRLSVPVLNMHLVEGIFFTLPDRKLFVFDMYEEAYLRKLSAFRDQCAAAIGEADITICVENTGGYERTPFLLKGLDCLLMSSAFGLTFDIGHNATANFMDEPVILKRAEKLRHMHIHDARQGKSNHLVLGTGELDVAKYIRLANQHSCRQVFEVKTVEGLRQSVKWLHECFDE